MKKKIQDKSWDYTLLKGFTCFALRLFYRIQVDGKENIPEGKAIIFAPNHQNALIDALMVLYAQPGRTVFLARADIFRKKSIAAFLRFLKILPIYRIRDGRNELDKNFEIFNEAVDILRDGVPVGMMPEGRQSFKRRLLPLVKGTFRIAYQAQEALPEKEVVIVPVGLDYTNYVHPFSRVVIRFGKPVSIGDYMGIYQENQAKGLNVLRDEIALRIGNLIQDIRSEKHYYDFYGISRIEAAAVCKKNGWKRTALNMLLARREVTLGLDRLELDNPAEADRLCKEYLAKYPHLGRHEKKGEEFTSSKHFVIFLIVLLLLLLALGISLLVLAIGF